MNAFQRLLTCSKFQGLRLWGMVDDPTCPSAKASPTSLISVRCRWRISSAKLARTPKVLTKVCPRSRVYSGSTIWVEWPPGVRPSRPRTSFSNSIGSAQSRELALYAPTAPAIFPLRLFLALVIATRRLPSRLMYSAMAKPKVMGTPCWPWVRPTVGMFAVFSAKVMSMVKNSFSRGTMLRFVTSLSCSARAVSITSAEVAVRWIKGRTFSPTSPWRQFTRALMLCLVRSSSLRTSSGDTLSQAALT